MQVQGRNSNIAEILQSLLPLLGDVTGKGIGGLAGGPVGAQIGGAIGQSGGQFARNTLQQAQQGQEPMMFGQSGIQQMQPRQQAQGASPLSLLMSGLSNVDMSSEPEQEKGQSLEELLKRMSELRKEQEELQASGATPQQLQSNAENKQIDFKQAYDSMSQDGKDILMRLLKETAKATLMKG